MRKQRMTASQHNINVFNRAAVVQSYAESERLTPCETVLFSAYVRPADDVLDLGVGTGRTTRALSTSAARYVGVDIASSMIEQARKQHPNVEFTVADATDLRLFDDESFDVVVFSFNGLDCIHPAPARRRCVDECRRVLRAGGRFIFSVHNPRALLDLSPLRTKRSGMHRALSFSYVASRRTGRLLPTRAAWLGHGYVVDRPRGGLVLYMASAGRIRTEFERLGFRHVQTLGSDFPNRNCPLWTPWYYYVFERA